MWKMRIPDGVYSFSEFFNNVKFYGFRSFGYIQLLEEGLLGDKLKL